MIVRIIFSYLQAIENEVKCLLRTEDTWKKWTHNDLCFRTKVRHKMHLPNSQKNKQFKMLFCFKSLESFNWKYLSVIPLQQICPFNHPLFQYSPSPTQDHPDKLLLNQHP